MAQLACHTCHRPPSDPVAKDSTAYTDSRYLMASADARPTCRRCLGAHWDSECQYSVTEARAAFQARLAVREGQSSALAQGTWRCGVHARVRDAVCWPPKSNVSDQSGTARARNTGVRTRTRSSPRPRSSRGAASSRSFPHGGPTVTDRTLGDRGHPSASSCEPH